ncbi:MAG: tRNA (guanosine(37)-N1)-methyltransferase TrmD [Endomicrobium sp.]|jgi:tRNA (guanine37-N1)-methyltransferase|nr:tRNA (guanosine(37)-N1)-methyltransferase TrmD [Endomicrobium sp.]
MKIDILTIFPKMFNGPFTESLISKAVEKKIVEINTLDIRSFSNDKHKNVDDKPFGGGSGMVIKIEPVYNAIKSLGIDKKNNTTSKRYCTKKPYVIYMSPQGIKLNNEIVKNVSKFRHLVIICGHYEGIDERISNYIDNEISIGDYVLTGGEIPAMVLVDSIVRILPGVVKQKSSLKNDSFFNGLLDYPCYTRPQVFNKHKVPKILLSGNHRKIFEWRIKESYKRTKKRRPDLLCNS